VHQFGWVMSAIVLPVMWGTFIHWCFQRLRRYQEQARRKTPENWEDYQI